MERAASSTSPAGRTRTSKRRTAIRIGWASVLCLAAGPVHPQPYKSVDGLPFYPVQPLYSARADVNRFLEQSTFGPSDALIAHVQAVGFEGYLEEQFVAPASTYPSLPEQPANALAVGRGHPDFARQAASAN